MIKIVNGNVGKLLDEMKLNALAHSNAIKLIQRQSKDAGEKKLSVKDSQKIDALEKAKKMYNPSKVIPVSIFGIVINFKTYEAFMKKIGGFSVQTKLHQDHIDVVYQKGTARGTLYLANLSDHFANFENIPAAVISDEEI